MNTSDILIIGAGAAGLMAARTLTKAGKKVTVLEARNRCGGRIHTLDNELFFQNAELGAEFIHGDLPVTLKLLNEARIEYNQAGAEMWHYKNGKFSREGEFKDWDLVIDHLGKLKTDVSIYDFLQQEFPGDKHLDLRTSVIKFVSGYDTADPHKASSFALRSEWQNEDDGAQHRVKGGYGTMIRYLEDEIKAAESYIYLNSVVKEINWNPGYVKTITIDGSVYEAAQLLIALPLGVLQADQKETGAIFFNPPIPDHNKAIRNMGFGAIIKILLEFDEPFWESKETKRLTGVDLKEMGFVISDEVIPTWWTQRPDHSPILTGWLGGPAAAEKKNTIDEEILQQSLQSLSNIFKHSPDELKDKLVSFHIINWTADPFTRGSYSYDTIAASTSRKVLNEPIANTIFFAGEYLYDGPAMGTIEAALTSGEKAVNNILSR